MTYSSTYVLSSLCMTLWTGNDSGMGVGCSTDLQYYYSSRVHCTDTTVPRPSWEISGHYTVYSTIYIYLYLVALIWLATVVTLLYIIIIVVITVLFDAPVLYVSWSFSLTRTDESKSAHSFTIHAACSSLYCSAHGWHYP
jgi:hypothetical protein